MLQYQFVYDYIKLSTYAGVYRLSYSSYHTHTFIQPTGNKDGHSVCFAYTEKVNYNKSAQRLHNIWPTVRPILIVLIHYTVTFDAMFASETGLYMAEVP